MELHQQTGFQRDLLFVLNGLEEPNGQEIKSELERSQDRTIQHGRLYTNLDALVEEGFIKKGEQDGRSNRYVLTNRGEQVLQDRFEWQRGYLSRNRGT